MASSMSFVAKRQGRIVCRTLNPYYANMPPIIACHTNSYGQYGAQGAIEQIRAAGLEYVEFPIRTAGFQSRSGDPPLLTNESTLEDLNRVATLIEKHGLRVSACTCMAGNPLDPANVA